APHGTARPGPRGERSPPRSAWLGCARSSGCGGPRGVCPGERGSGAGACDRPTAVRSPGIAVGEWVVERPARHAADRSALSALPPAPLVDPVLSGLVSEYAGDLEGGPCGDT